MTRQPRPSTNLKQYWSHGGITNQIRSEIESILASPAQVMPGAEPGIVALTSLAPGAESIAVQRASIASWRAAGLDVRAFNHPSEIPELQSVYDVEFVPVAESTERIFGKPYVPIHAMLQWAARDAVPVLLVNSDIELALAPSEMRRIRYIAEGGLCYFVRHNHDGAPHSAVPSADGFDAFLLHGRDAALFGECFLSMGAPFWDYWLPCTFLARGLPVHAVEFPAAFHRNHGVRWSWTDWHCCAAEFDRVLRSQGDARPGLAGVNSWHVRSEIERARQPLRRDPETIRDWVERTFGDGAAKTFVELGAHRGTDTSWLAATPGVTLHAFEPDPRNDVPAAPNVVVNRAAIAARDGRCALTQSAWGWGVEWTHSSSIRRPKLHFARYPVTFGETVEVDAVALDTYWQRRGLGSIDFVWANVQGAECDLIEGG
ncbi:MAG TPA: FkbM family methyltransferase, partial [Candidatus Tumulicola sp.]|nr:FkbM family methyltransferase [Candidatus Tumulicola sp.]